MLTIKSFCIVTKWNKHEYIKGLESGTSTRRIDDEQYKQIEILNKQCRDFITKAYSNKEKYGISFKVHQQLMLMERLLDRLFWFLNCLQLIQK